MMDLSISSLVARVWRKRMRNLSNGYRVSFEEEEKVMGIDGGESCTTE